MCARVFISYKRDVEPDEPVALALYQALKIQHDVFIDQKRMGVGTHWAERIEKELRRTDFLIVFLSTSSVQSEMVKGELEMAHHLAKEQQGRPVILPVRIDYSEPFKYPLSAYLNGINWAVWKGLKDTPTLIEELQQAVTGNGLSPTAAEQTVNPGQPEGKMKVPPPNYAAQPQSLDLPEGTMDPDSALYIQRPTDQLALSAIQRDGVTVTIKGPRQMGKSSLLIQVMNAATEADKVVAFLDFQLFDQTNFASADGFFKGFCSALTDELELEDRVADYWNEALSPGRCCTRYLAKYLLKELDTAVVIAMDEVDAIFGTEFRSDFFGMLRSWHNNRARKKVWKKLDLALVTSTEPYQLIADLTQSPFNVGQVLELTDFTAEQVADLNQRHGQPCNKKELTQLMDWLQGHPYLIRRALYLLATEEYTLKQLLAEAIEDRGPFGDHLRYHLFRMYDQTPLRAGLIQVIQKQTCSDEHLFFKLRGAGLVRREGQQVLPRCRLYAEYFQEHLRG
ncbi:AAA-like domain-containing protein [Acaryochloris marina]|uniref:AAA-like domain-containing protein n=1 Tax=Acaryochloris marina TaxID=155978 RepID=UPI001BAF2C43|nr:AAA-like domain-containing protein [Acaryochloris marina]QUY43881.1 AAA-like domain-containing protein [Acaryochloris marina S15]